MFARFTERARKVMARANQEAQRFNHEYIGTEHILLALVSEGSGVGANVLRNLGVDLAKVRVEVEKLVKVGPDAVWPGEMPYTPRAKKIVEHAIKESQGLHHNYVGTEHILLGLLSESESVAAQVLVNLGLTLQGVREEVRKLVGAGPDVARKDRGPVGVHAQLTELLSAWPRLSEEARKAILDDEFDGFRKTVKETYSKKP